MKILDLGCGSRKTPTATGVDIDPKSQADVIHDLNVFPYPFEDNTFDEVVTNHVLEHLDDTLAVLNELHRITKNGGKIKLRVPHYTGVSAWGDLSHKRTFSAGMRVYIKNFMGDKFRVDKTSLHYISYMDRDRCLRNRLVSTVADGIANVNIKFSDKFLGHWIGGFQEIYLELTVLK